jgi:hypothetical protein
MKMLSTFSYTSSIAAIIIAVSSMYAGITMGLPSMAIIILTVPFAVLGTMQLLHTLKVRQFIHGTFYHQTDQLDEELLNDLQGDDYVIHTPYWQKIVTTVNSIALSLWFIYVILEIRSVISNLVDSDSITDLLLGSLFVVLLLSAIPTIIFNLRTHQLTRVVKG